MKGESSKVVRSGQFKYGLYGVVSDRGLNPKRVTNEDSYLLLQDVPLFAVADGVGGQNAGEVASQVTVQILKNQFLKKRVPANKAPFLDHVISYANRYLYDMAVDDELLSGMATTLAVVVLERKQAIISHVGDSRVYRFTAGKLHRETIDHSLAEDSLQGNPLEYELVNRNIITRALGVEPEVEPETKIISIPPDTTFLLCTDGITRHINDGELEEVLRRETDPQTACEIFKEMCYEQGAKDNLTVMVVRVESSSWLSGGVTRESAEDSAHPEAAPRNQVARFHVELQDQAADDSLESVNPGATTFSSRLNREGELNAPPPLAPPEKHWAVTPLLVALALVVGFFLGIYVQPVLSPTRPSGLVDQEPVSAQDIFEEGRRAFEAGDYAHALNAFMRAANLSPEAEYYQWMAKAAEALAAAKSVRP